MAGDKVADGEGQPQSAHTIEATRDNRPKLSAIRLDQARIEELAHARRLYTSTNPDFEVAT